MAEHADVRVVDLRVVVADDRPGAARRDRSRSDPARAPVPGLVRLLPHRRPGRRAVADLAVRPVVRLRRARPGARDRGRDRRRVRGPRGRERAAARPVARRHRRADDPARHLPRLLGGVGKKPSIAAPAPGRARHVPSVVALVVAEEDAVAGARRLCAGRRRCSSQAVRSCCSRSASSRRSSSRVFGNDRDLRGTAFGVAHAHYLLWGTALFALLGGLVYWWPKIFGRLLGTRLTARRGRAALRRASTARSSSSSCSATRVRPPARPASPTTGAPPRTT